MRLLVRFPNKLKANTKIIMANPGIIAKEGSLAIISPKFSFSIIPHEGIGGCTPIPKKLNPDSINIAAAKIGCCNHHNRSQYIWQNMSCNYS